MENLWHRTRQALPRLVRFGAVGVSNTVVDLVVLNVLLYSIARGDTHAGIFPVIATISFIAATLNSFYWNRRWTFKAKSGSISRDLSRFYVITIVSFVINVGISSFLVWLDPFPRVSPTLWANAAKIIATGVSLLFNFVGYDRLVFKNKVS